MLKRKTKYNSKWETSFSWLWKYQNDQFSAYCKTWEKSFSISGDGVGLANHISKEKKY